MSQLVNICKQNDFFQEPGFLSSFMLEFLSMQLINSAIELIRHFSKQLCSEYLQYAVYSFYVFKSFGKIENFSL